LQTYIGILAPAVAGVDAELEVQAMEITLPKNSFVGVVTLGVLLSSGLWTIARAEGTGLPQEPYRRLFTLGEPSAMSLTQAAAAQKPPEPEHTGLSALVHATGSDFVAFPKRKSTWVILGVGGAAALLVHPWDTEINNELQEANTLKKVLTLGKYLGYGWVQMGAAAGMYAIGRYAMEPEQGTNTNKWSHLGFDLLRAQILAQAFTYGIKYAAQRDRPTGECCAFPSGHASVTFATAAVIERHFGYRGSWPMFLIAGYVSASRLTDNRHYQSDVLFGSALGMASGWTVVGRHGRDTFTMYPVPVRGGVALAGQWSPHLRKHS
jgi:membrane-associated phospholipid phosphatase